MYMVLTKINKVFWLLKIVINFYIYLRSLRITLNSTKFDNKLSYSRVWPSPCRKYFLWAPLKKKKCNNSCIYLYVLYLWEYTTCWLLGLWSDKSSHCGCSIITSQMWLLRSKLQGRNWFPPPHPMPRRHCLGWAPYHPQYDLAHPFTQAQIVLGGLK